MPETKALESVEKRLAEALELSKKYKAAYELLFSNTLSFLKKIDAYEEWNKSLREKVKFYGDKNIELHRVIEDVHGIDVTNLKERISDLEDQLVATESEKDDYLGLCMMHIPHVLEDIPEVLEDIPEVLEDN